MKKIYVANWKMNGTKQDVEEYVEVLSNHLFLDTVILALPFVYLDCAAKLLSPCLHLSAQNLHQNTKGAYTGDVSANMIKDVGCEYVILGHSERRLSGEANNLISQKLTQAFENDLIPILCIGETLEQRDSGQKNHTLYMQLEESLPAGSTKKTFIVAYEPVWAIGTGKVPTLQEISDTCTFIHDYLEEHNFTGISILYGGSVIPDNAYHLKSCANVSGFLVGGASLKAVSFLRIIQ